MIISLSGFIGSGKNTVGNILREQYGFEIVSFASAVKDCISIIFNWDREALEGITPKHREWRNQIDEWWSKKLDIPDFTPRYAMQHFGTDLMRDKFNRDIWVHCLESKLHRYENVVVCDTRFKNEIKMLLDNGAMTVWVKRDVPEWYPIALKASYGDPVEIRNITDLGVHISEWDWLSEPMHRILENKSSIDDLTYKIDEWF